MALIAANAGFCAKAYHDASAMLEHLLHCVVMAGSSCVKLLPYEPMCAASSAPESNQSVGPGEAAQNSHQQQTLPNDEVCPDTTHPMCFGL